MTSNSDVITFNTDTRILPDKTLKISENLMLNLCNYNYMKYNKIRWQIWSDIFNNQIKNLIDLNQDKEYYNPKTFYNLRNLFIANARNVKRLRKIEYDKIGKMIVILQKKFKCR